jgi:hypothetical protein
MVALPTRVNWTALHVGCNRHCRCLCVPAPVFILCRSCTLQPDSLHPLARLASLRQLGIRGCAGVSMAALQHLLATAEQGCLLTVSVSADSLGTLATEAVSEDSLQALHSAVAGQRGSRNTPALDWM